MATNRPDVVPSPSPPNPDNPEEPLLLAAGPQRVRAPPSKAKTALVVLALALLVAGGVAAAVLLSLPATFSCGSGGGYYVVSLPFPTIYSVDPPAVCPGKGQRLTLRGKGFVVAGDQVPSVTVGAVAAESVLALECSSESVRRRDVKTCQQLSFVVPEINASDKQQTPVVRVSNPVAWEPALGSKENISCIATSLSLNVFPAPTISSVSVPIACEGSRQRVVLSGSYFLTAKRSDGVELSPNFTMCGRPIDARATFDACDAFEVDGFVWVHACKSAAVDVDTAQCAGGRLGRLVLRNPAPTSCRDSTNGTNVYVAVHAAITSASPRILSSSSSSSTVTLSGTDVVYVSTARGTENPKVTVSGAGSSSVVRLSSCDRIDVSGTDSVYRCEKVNVILGSFSSAVPMIPEVSVTVPLCPTCGGTAPVGTLLVMPSPVITAVTPASVCAGSGASVVISGTFYSVDGDSSTQTNLTLGGVAAAAEMSGCDTSVLGPYTIRKCSSMRFNVPKKTPYGDVPIVISSGCADGCTVSKADTLKHIPYPVVSKASVSNVCSAVDTAVRVSGSNMLSFNSGLPSFVVDNVSVTVASVDECTTTSTGFRLCKVANIVNPADLPVGPASVRVSNGESTCGGQETSLYTIVPMPTITSATGHWCDTTGGSFSVSGSKFSQQFGQFVLKDKSGQSYAPGSASFVNDSYLLAKFAANALPAGQYDAVITNAGGCVDTATSSVTVEHNILEVWDVEPPVLYSGIPVTVTLYTSNFGQKPTGITATHSSGAVPSISIPQDKLEFYPDGRVTFFAPAGTFAASGSYAFTVSSPNTCSATSAATEFSVVTTASLNISSLSPGFVFSKVSSTFTMTVPGARVSATTLPRVFAVGNAGAAAIPIGPVYVISDDKVLVRVTPGTISEGTYNVLVSSGSPGSAAAGYLSAALRSLGRYPSKISTVVPHTFTRDSTSITIYGENFSETLKHTIVLDCDTLSTTSASVIRSVSATLIKADLDIDSLAEGSVCVLTVREDDGSSASYSAISVQPRNRAVSNWHSTAELPAPRCGSAVATASVGTTNYVYAIGGDLNSNCNGVGATQSVLVGQVSQFGKIVSWATTSALPEARAFASAERIGQYVYVLGGHDGSNPKNSVYRAHILDPSQAPVLRAGVWCYRVSALFPSSDYANPLGESLASNPVAVEIQSESSMAVKLEWDAVAGANSYRLYRTPATGSSCSDVNQLVETFDYSYVDSGASTTAVAPQAVGSLGKWVSAEKLMSTPRYGHASAVVKASADQNYIMAFGGNAASGVATTYETAMITVSPPSGPHASETHHIGSWSDGSRTLSTRAFWKAAVLDSRTMSNYTSEQVIVLGPGLDASGKVSNVHSVNYWQSTGDMARPAWTEVTTGVSAYGECLFVTADYMYLIGGSDSTLGTKNSFVALGQTPPPNENPIGTYKNLPNDMPLAVTKAGCAMASGSAFVIGGVGAAGITSTVQQIAV
eukprot:m51a1_g11071 hypothetical protein (1477) ;mRNA; f:551451-556513